MEKLFFRISWILLGVGILIIPIIGRENVHEEPWEFVIAAFVIAAIALRMAVLYMRKVGKRHENSKWI